MNGETKAMRVLTAAEAEAVSGGATSEELAASAMAGAASGAAIGASFGFALGPPFGVAFGAVGSFVGGFFGGMQYAASELMDYCF